MSVDIAGDRRPAGQPDRAAARLPFQEQAACSPLQQRPAGAGEAAQRREAQGGPGQLAQAAGAAARGAAALGEGQGAAEGSAGDAGGSAAAEGGGVQEAGGETRRGEGAV